MSYERCIEIIKEYEEDKYNYGWTLSYFVMPQEAYDKVKEHIVDDKLLGYEVRIIAYNWIAGIPAGYDRIIADDDKEYYGEE